MQIEGTYKAEVNKMLEYVKSKYDPQIEIDRAHQHHTNSKMHLIIKNFKKSFQSDTKQMKNIKKWEE
jgi:hypothetical protein